MGGEMEREVKEGGRRRREGGRGCNTVPCVPRSVEGLSAGCWRSSRLFIVVGAL